MASRFCSRNTTKERIRKLFSEPTERLQQLVISNVWFQTQGADYSLMTVLMVVIKLSNFHQLTLSEQHNVDVLKKDSLTNLSSLMILPLELYQQYFILKNLLVNYLQLLSPEKNNRPIFKADDVTTGRTTPKIEPLEKCARSV